MVYNLDTEYQREFGKIKQFISSPMRLKPFIQEGEIELYVNFYSLGIGLVLAQRNPQVSNKRCLIWMDSTKLTDV